MTDKNAHLRYINLQTLQGQALADAMDGGNDIHHPETLTVYQRLQAESIRAEIAASEAALAEWEAALPAELRAEIRAERTAQAESQAEADFGPPPASAEAELEAAPHAQPEAAVSQIEPSP